MKKRKTEYPAKRTMNLYYKPDRTTKPATIALYVLFSLVCLLGLSKVLIYDVWLETMEARQELAREEAELTDILRELTDFNEVKERYNRYAATEEERAVIDRMEILSLLDGAVASLADVDVISVGGSQVHLRFSGVTLSQTAQIAKALEESPLVESTTVNTAVTTAEGNDLVQADLLIWLVEEGEQ